MQSLFGLPQPSALGGYLEQALEVGHVGDEAYVGDAQVGGYDRLEVDAGQRHEVFHILGRYFFRFLFE